MQLDVLYIPSLHQWHWQGRTDTPAERIFRSSAPAPEGTRAPLLAPNPKTQDLPLELRLGGALVGQAAESISFAAPFVPWAVRFVLRPATT